MIYHFIYIRYVIKLLNLLECIIVMIIDVITLFHLRNARSDVCFERSLRGIQIDIQKLKRTSQSIAARYIEIRMFKQVQFMYEHISGMFVLSQPLSRRSVRAFPSSFRWLCSPLSHHSSVFANYTFEICSFQLLFYGTSAMEWMGKYFQTKNYNSRMFQIGHRYFPFSIWVVFQKKRALAVNKITSFDSYPTFSKYHFK